MICSVIHTAHLCSCRVRHKLNFKNTPFNQGTRRSLKWLKWKLL